MKRLRAFIGLAGGLLTIVAFAQNPTSSADPVETSQAEDTQQSSANPRTEHTDTPGSAGVRAFVDPETGRLTANPTAAQLQRSTVERRALALSRSTAGLTPFELSRGGQGVHLQGRFRSALRVERQPDGSFRVVCGPDGHEGGHAHDAAAMAQTPAPTTPRPSSSASTAPER